jgi:hypothetical protein
MNNIFRISIRNLLLAQVLLLILFSFHASAQLFTRILPNKWTSKAASIERTTWFRFGKLKPENKSKEEIFKKSIASFQKSIFYPIQAVNTLIDLIEKEAPVLKRINIYITSFDINNPGKVDVSKTPDGQILFVFAPAEDKDTHPDIGKYFVIANDNICYEISVKEKDSWADKYINNVIVTNDGLRTTVDPNAKENQMDGHVSDTRSLYYLYEDLTEFLVEERKYQERKFNKNVSGIEIDLASYTDEGDNDGYYKNRLILQFEFTNDDSNGSHEKFYIDDGKNFYRRLKKTLKTQGSIIRIKSINKNRKNDFTKRGFNHSELCPDDCPQ